MGNPFEGLSDIKDYTGSLCVANIFTRIEVSISLLLILGTCRQWTVFRESSSLSSPAVPNGGRIIYFAGFLLTGELELDELRLMGGIMDSDCGHL